MELISVIVPVYNVEQYLMRCVDSIRKQTYQNLEIILVDDGSPDRCPELCEEIKSLDSRVKVIHKKNGGLGFARNSGLDMATGAFVTFIDSDDWISEAHIENLYSAAIREKADVAIGSCTSVSSDGNRFPHTIQVKQKVYEGEAVLKELLLPLIGPDADYPQDVQFQPSCCFNLYRLDLINDNGIRFPSEKVAISEDRFFSVDLFSHAKRISVTDEKGYFYFENTASLSRKYDAGRLTRTIRFHEAMQHKLVQYGLKDEADFRLERTFLMDIRVLIRMIVLSDMPRKNKYREIQNVLNHALVKEVLNAYPVDAYIPAMRVLVKAMRRGNIRYVYCLMQIREYAKRTKGLKKLLKQVGIGK